MSYFTKKDFEMYNKFKKRGYIFDSIIDEQNLLSRFEDTREKIMKNNFITEFTICQTMGCNLRCTYCHENHKQHENFSTLSGKSLNIILDYILKYNNEISKKQNLKNRLRIQLFRCFNEERLVWKTQLLYKNLDLSVYDIVFSIFNSKKSKDNFWKISYCSATFGFNYCFTPNGIINTCTRCIGQKSMA
jgi:hypothetical protein